MASCTVCRHADAPAINDALLAGEPRLAVARRYGLSEPSVRRHWHRHLPAVLRLQSETEYMVERARLLRELDAGMRVARTHAVRAQRRGWSKAQWRDTRRWMELAGLRARVLELGVGGRVAGESR